MDQADIETLNSVSSLRISVECITLKRVSKIVTNGRYINSRPVNTEAGSIENWLVNNELIRYFQMISPGT